MSIPAGKHNDWWGPFKLIPRTFMAFESLVPPRILGKLASKWLREDEDAFGFTHLDITPMSTWAVGYHLGHGWFPFLYFTFRTSGGWHFRTGWRYDYVDSYYTFVVITIKRIY